MLFGVTASDTVTFAGAALVLGAVAIVRQFDPGLTCCTHRSGDCTAPGVAG